MSIPKERLHQLIEKMTDDDASRVEQVILTLVLRGPQTAGDKRSNDEPFYVEKHCEVCGQKLVYAFLVENPDAPEEARWYDEFICPTCVGKIVADWPPSYRAGLNDSVHGKTYTMEEVLRELQHES